MYTYIHVYLPDVTMAIDNQDIFKRYLFLINGHKSLECLMPSSAATDVLGRIFNQTSLSKSGTDSSEE